MRPLTYSLIIAIIFHTSYATAATPARAAERKIANGQRLMEKGRYQEALDLFASAHAETHSARSLAQVAIAEQSLENFVDAEAHFLEVLAATDDPWVAKNREVLQQCLDTVRTKLGKVLLVGQLPDAATVRINSNEVLATSSPITVPAGQTNIEVSAPAHKPFNTNVDVPAGGTVRIAVALQNTSPPQPLPSPTETAAQKETTPPLVLLPEEPKPSRRVWPKVLGGTLVLGGVVSIVKGVIKLRRDGDCADKIMQPGVNCSSFYATENKGINYVAVGTALMLTGAIVLWTASNSPATKVELSWGPSGGPTIGAVGTF